MALRSEDQFYFLLTSDGSHDSHPSNTTSTFQISLNEPINVGDADWEVALQTINYPYSWTNIGPAANVFMKYYVDGYTGVREINFPDWQCKSMEEVVSFIGKEISQKMELQQVQRVKTNCFSNLMNLEESR
jgi:hypothetical protein